MQTVLRYNTPQVTANKGLSLRARAVTNTNRLEVCLAYTGARPNTGMVLVEVELITGWRAVSLERLTNQVEALVQRVDLEEEDNMVIKHQEQQGGHGDGVRLLQQGRDGYCSLQYLEHFNTFIYNYHN